MPVDDREAFYVELLGEHLALLVEHVYSDDTGTFTGEPLDMRRALPLSGAGDEGNRVFQSINHNGKSSPRPGAAPLCVDMDCARPVRAPYTGCIRPQLESGRLRLPPVVTAGALAHRGGYYRAKQGNHRGLQRTGLQMNTATDTELDIHVTDRASMEASIEEAMLELVNAARISGTHGILITRLDHGHFRAALSKGVPFGYTEERDQRERL